MIDPLALVFIPGAAAMIAGMAVPFIGIAYVFARRRAQRRNDHARCGHCDQPFKLDDPSIHVSAGIYVCASCGERQRASLRLAIPILGSLGLGLVMLSGIGVVLGGEDAGWWLQWRFIAALLPSVTVIGGLWTGLRFMQRRTRQLNDREVMQLGLESESRSADVPALQAAEAERRARAASRGS